MPGERRTVWNARKQDDESICDGCGLLVEPVDVTFFTVSDGAGECDLGRQYAYWMPLPRPEPIPPRPLPDTLGDVFLYDSSHETCGVVEYCGECESYRYKHGVEPGEHDLYGLRDVSRGSDEDSGGGACEVDENQATLEALF